MLALFTPLNSGLATATAPSATATAGVVVPTGRVNSWYDSGKRLLSDVRCWQEEPVTWMMPHLHQYNTELANPT